MQYNALMKKMNHLFIVVMLMGVAGLGNADSSTPTPTFQQTSFAPFNPTVSQINTSPTSFLNSSQINMSDFSTNTSFNPTTLSTNFSASQNFQSNVQSQIQQQQTSFQNAQTSFESNNSNMPTQTNPAFSNMRMQFDNPELQHLNFNAN